MPLFIDEKFISSIAHLLRNFKKKSTDLWNFSCPVCGDSKTKKFKARGYLYRYKDGLLFKCHKCGISQGFGEFVRYLDTSLYKEYVCQSYIETTGSVAPEQKRIAKDQALFKKKKPVYKPAPIALAGCSTIASLGPDHAARIYIESRQIPTKFLTELYWTDDFPSVVDKVCPDHDFKLKKEGRIIIPFLDQKRQLVAIQGRSLEQDGIRYITIKANEDAPRIFGLDRLDKMGKRIYVVEGPFDSLFLPNCIALAGSDIPATFPTDRTVIIYDNEQKKKITCDKIDKAIDRGFHVCIWPDNIIEKDINLMVMNGYVPEKLRVIIDSHSYKGLEAKVWLESWRKNAV